MTAENKPAHRGTSVADRLLPSMVSGLLLCFRRPLRALPLCAMPRCPRAGARQSAAHRALFAQNKPAPTGGICCSGGRGSFSVILRLGSASVRLPSRSAELDALPHRIRDRNCIVLMRATVVSIEKLYLTGPFPFSAWPAPRPRRSMRRKPDTSPPARRPRPWAARSGRPWRWPCPASRPPWPPCG